MYGRSTVFKGVFFSSFMLFSSLCAENHGDGGNQEGGETHATTGEHASSSKESPVREPYIQVGPLTISIVKGNEIKGYVQLTVNLLAEKKEDYALIKHIIPHLQNDYVIQLSTILSNFWITGSEPKLENVKNILQHITNKSLGHNRIKALLFHSYFFVQPPQRSE